MFFTISTIVFFFLAIIISQFILDPNLRIAYWLMLLLIYVSFSNIMLSTYFYIKLREQPGLQGDRGSSGEKGPKGSDGVCIVQPECGPVQNKYNTIIEEEIRKINKDYDDIITKNEKGILLNDSDKKLKQVVDDFINKIQHKAETDKWQLSDIKKTIKSTFN